MQGVLFLAASGAAKFFAIQSVVVARNGTDFRRVIRR
jgi:hypothetical protein